MPQDINLIPNSVVKERSLQSGQNKFIWFCFLLIILTVIVTVVMGVLSTNASAKLTAVKEEINQKELKIKSLQDVEKSAVTLQQRLAFIKNIFDSKIVYSKLITEIESKLISGIAVTNVDVSADDFVVTITGAASSTTVLQNYIQNISKTDSLFLNLKILEVSINEGKGTVDFKVEATLDSKKIVGY